MTSIAWRQSDWWKSKENIADACAQLFDLYLGREGEAFGRCMSFLNRCLDSDQLLTSIRSPELRVALAILGQSYQYLLSVWQDLSEGRLASATDHWRSLAEAPDYILATSLNEDFAREWADPKRQTTLKPERARRIVRKELNKRQAGKGDEWDQRRRQDLDDLQAYSHVSSEAAALTVLKPRGTLGGHFVTPEGRYAPDVKEGAIYSAHLARQLVGAVAVALEAALPDEWQQEAWLVWQNGKLALEEEHRRVDGNRDEQR